MKGYRNKLVACGLAAAMIFSFAGCGETDNDKATETTADTQATETEATETTTAAEDNYDIMDGFEMQNPDGELLLCCNDFTLKMPDHDNWGYEQTSATSLEIYLKGARDAGYGGNLVTIMAFDPDDTSYEDFPSYVIAGKGPNCGKTFIALYPTDVQFDPADAQQQAEYNELSEYLSTIAEGSADSPFQISK